MRKWVRPIKPNYTGEINKEHREHIASVEEEVKKYLPSSDDLPATKKDNEEADKQLALRIRSPLSTSLAIVGMFATDQTRFFACASRDRLIQRYKKEAQDNWIKNQAEVLEDIKLSGRRRTPGNN